MAVSDPALILRITAVVIGGYAFMVGAVALLSISFVRAGTIASEAVVGSSMIGFLFYLALILWGFAERRLVRVVTVMIAGSGATIGLAALLAPSLG